MRTASLAAWACCRSDSATALPSLPKTHLGSCDTTLSAGRWCPAIPRPPLHHRHRASSRATGWRATGWRMVRQIGFLTQSLGGKGITLDRLAGGVVWAIQFQRHVALILLPAFDQPSRRPQRRRLWRDHQSGGRLRQGSPAAPPRTSARLTDQYETDRAPKSAPNPLQKMDVPDWLFSRDPARGGTAFPSNLCGPPDCFTDTSRLLRRRPCQGEWYPSQE
jgi:hypothetical protein